MNDHRPATITRTALTLFLLTALLNPSVPAAETGHRFTIDASAAPTAPETGYFEMGGAAANRSPDGHTISINSRYLTRDGVPWLPVMGEFHYSRYPARLWEDEILKMKAGGIQIVSTYVFWIHHEEVEGKFDWSGRRDLRRFVELCAKHGMYVWMRIGPWAHGEVRNGGLPDWLIAKGPTRVNDPGYLGHARIYYNEIGRQLHGLLWRDGGPVIGVQIENEYANRAPEGGAAHIATLKKMALAAGLDVPVYTVTGWDNAVYPARSVTPVFGGYPDEPWGGSREEVPPDKQGVYQFAPIRGNAGILQGETSRSDAVQFWHYPRFTAELGAGAQLTYHRRVVIAPADIPPIAISALGSGVTLLGYYMYHGGTNPEGKLTTLQESQATDYPNDLPVKSYDFQAPLGEFGQVNATYRALKVIHQFIADFGSDLATMTRKLPDIVPSGMSDTATLRVAARTRGDEGFLFFNNYIRHYPMPEQKAVQVILRLPSETLAIPAEPVNVPSQTAFYWPVNLPLGDARLTYATAQPFAKLKVGGTDWFFFEPSPGIVPEFAFAAGNVASLQAKNGVVSRHNGRISVTGLRPAPDVAIELATHAEERIAIVLLSTEAAENLWKVSLGSRERMILTEAEVFSDGGTVHLRSHHANGFSFALFPDDGKGLTVSSGCQKTGTEGIFMRYAATIAPKTIGLTVEKIRDAETAAPVRMGPPVAWRQASVAMVPDDAAFAGAGAWRITVPADALRGVKDVFLDLDYVGDIGRLYEGARLLDDNFYDGKTWKIGLNELPPEASARTLRIEILPLRRDAPIYLPKDAWPDFGGSAQLAALKSVRADPVYEVTLSARGRAGASSGQP